MRRIARLAFTLTRRSPFRVAMLSGLTAIAIIVFALVSELSRVSRQGLDEAIVQDSGLRGSYQVTFDSSLQIDDANAFDAVDAVAQALDLDLWGFWQDSPDIRSECPPYEQMGEQSLRFLWRAPSEPFSLPFGQVSGIDTSWCIGGQEIPESALFLPGDEDRAVFGSRLYVDPQYWDLVMLSTLGPVRRGFILTSGSDAQLASSIQSAIEVQIQPIAARDQVDASSVVTVARLDLDSANVQDASKGIAITYGLISWGVLTLAGIALLAVQVIVARQRSWFYGLARALGATRRQIAILLSVDAALVLLAASALASLVLGLSQTTVKSFAATAFGVEATVMSARTAVALVLGLTTIFITVAIASTAVVVRRDPLETLEAPRD